MIPPVPCRQLIAVVLTVAGCVAVAVGAGAVVYWASGKALR